MGFEPKKPPAVKLPGMRGRQKILEKEVEESEEEIYIGRLEYKVLTAGCCGISYAEPLFKYLQYVSFDKADKLSVLIENVCSATVEGEEILFFQYRVQGRRNGRLEYTPCVEMLDKSATSEWEIVTATPPSIPAGIVQYSNNKTAKVAYKRKITVPISPSTADVDVVVATSEIIAKQKKSILLFIC